MQTKVAIARISRGCNERTEIGTWLVACYSDPVLDDSVLLHALDVIDIEPTSVARNRAVMRARSQGYGPNDILLMVDNDMVPADDFYNRAVRFLMDHPGPVMFGSPYRGAAPRRDVQVSDALSGKRLRVEDAVGKRHIDQVSGMGTGLFACNMAAYDAIEEAGLLPWFDYIYADPPFNSLVKATEDFDFCVKLNKAGGRIFTDWESWSLHCKVERIGKPVVGEMSLPTPEDFAEVKIESDLEPVGK